MARNDREKLQYGGRAIVYCEGLPAALGVVERADAKGAFLRVGGHPVGSHMPVTIELCDRSKGVRWLTGMVVDESDRGIEVRFSAPETRASTSDAARYVPCSSAANA